MQDMTEDSSARGPSKQSTTHKRIVVRRNGPYEPDPGIAIVDHLGVPVTAEAPVRLCRCGQSQSKPFCDDSHITRGFVDAKDPRRVPDKLDVYAGQQAFVFDNRGTCAHSAFCTDRLNAVFHLGEEPFIAPSGARLDDLVNAVRRCPSGALGIGIGPVRDTNLSDINRPPQIEISRDGPYRVTGHVELVDEDGVPIAQNAGASREHVSLCRCGSSLNKPFCSGMHWSVAFRDPLPDPLREPTLFEWAGGYPALLDMTRIFYSRYVPEDPLLGRCSPRCRRTIRNGSRPGSARCSAARASTPSAMAAIGGWSRSTSAKRSGRSSARCGPPTWCRAPTMPDCRPIRNSAPPSSPISNGARGSHWRIPGPAPRRRRTCGAALVVGLQRDAGRAAVGQRG
ncbi:hypothetical protein CI41S_76270 [Bradyrhizobium ivorense]|nr:CDGSH iron-sulfur domain-containing protein [Bradyrhizobium ivorense]VIO80979.1 hypothetical protein CI41S_76270 [Bradyrhizobium ivorense]